MIRLLRVFLLLLYLMLFGCTDELTMELAGLGFFEVNVPSIHSDQWKAANEDFPSYFVELHDQLLIRRATSEEEVREYIVFEDGAVRYIGVDRGEWGGGLFLEEFNEANTPLLAGNVRAMVPIDNDLYIIEGLAHLSISEGSVHVIRNYSEPKEPLLLTNLPDAPAVIHVDRKTGPSMKITIVGFQSFMEFVPDDELKVVKRNTFWAGLNPSSVVKHGDHYIIGIRSGVAVVSPGIFGLGRRIRYFIPRTNEAE